MKKKYNLPLYWRVLIIYALVTGGVFYLVNPKEQYVSLQAVIWARGVFLLFLAGALMVQQYASNRFKQFLLWLLAYSSLGVLYKDTALLNQMFFQKIDPILINADQFIFGFQPSVEFSKKKSSVFWSELFFFGYFFYYLFPLIVGGYLLFQNNKKKIINFANTLIISFVIYYVIFILLPASGPQFYLPFPDNFIQSQGVFGQIVKLIQAGGEAPTAAFPSSHVGISFILLFWLYKNEKKILKWFILPVTILCFSTIYIKAHYAIDVFAGIVSGVIIADIINKWILK